MEPERHEVYERIPWEALESKTGDRQWLYIGLAGAVTLGALAFSFMRSQPVEAPPAVDPVTSTAPAAQPPPQASPPSTVATPLMTAEADLFAVEPERLVDAAAAHAEWFAVEYFSVDGSEQATTAIGALLPQGIPPPLAPEGTQVFVDWAGTQRVVEVAPMSYQVDVLVRSLLSTGDGGFIRQPTRTIRVEIGIGEDGLPRVKGAPGPVDQPPGAPAPVDLREVPAEVAAAAADVGEIVGGAPTASGGWRVVAMVEGEDGVSRPVTVEIP